MTKTRVSSLADGRPSRAKHPQVRRPDVAALREQGRESARARLDRTKEPVGVLRDAVDAIADLEPKVERLRNERNEIALAAVVYHDARGVFHAAGIARNAMTKIKLAFAESDSLPSVDELRQRARNVGIPEHADWTERLPDVAEQWVRLDAELAELKEIRNRIVVEQIRSGALAGVDAAAITGVGQARISNLLRQYQD
jgi:hypothetical protein